MHPNDMYIFRPWQKHMCKIALWRSQMDRQTKRTDGENDMSPDPDGGDIISMQKSKTQYVKLRYRVYQLQHRIIRFYLPV